MVNAAPKRIAILVPTASQFARGILRGISAYAQLHRRWYFYHAVPSPQHLPNIRRIKPDGIISLSPTNTFARSLQRFEVPFVNCSGNAPKLGIATVRVDNAAIGRMAAEYYLARGFWNFACCGRSERVPLMERAHAFRDAIAAAGYPCHLFMKWPSVTNPLTRSWLDSRLDKALTRWLRSLPKPVAILTSDEMVAIELNQHCAREGIAVPDEVAILGVDNDDVICQMTYPAISSISLPHQEIGYIAAEVLDRLLAGEPVPEEPHLLEPTEVVTRESTDLLAIRDPDVADALQYIRTHDGEPITIEDVVAATVVSRRALEIRFREVLRRTILQEIQRAHVEKARRLLRETDLAIETVAHASGFKSRERLAVVFRQQTGETPVEYRRRFLSVARPVAWSARSARSLNGRAGVAPRADRSSPP